MICINIHSPSKYVFNVHTHKKRKTKMITLNSIGHNVLVFFGI